jgi:hypothetical protein
VLEAMSGEFDRARQQMALARNHLAELGLRTAAMWMELFAAQAEMLADAPEAAERAARDAERMAREIGDRWFLAIAIADLAHVVIAQGRLDEAAAIVRRIDTVPAPSDLEWLIKRHAARGKLAARQGHAENGVADARRAVELADTTDLLVFRADAYRDLAEVLLAVDRPGEAESAAATALELHEAKMNIAGASNARQFLQTIHRETS